MSKEFNDEAESLLREMDREGDGWYGRVQAVVTQQRAMVELYKNEMDRCLDQLAELSGLPRTEVGYEPAINKLRATIQKLEVLVKGLEAELEEYRSIAEREGAEIAVSQLSREQAKVKQLEARVKFARHEAVRAFVHGEDKLCLVCGAKEPCELKDDPASPCTFEPTPMELLRKVRELAVEKQQLEAKLAQLQGEA